MSVRLVVVFIFIYLSACVIYLPGLSGSFIFDDFPNLKDMGTYGDIDTWEKIRAFVQGGIAGPTGRPISLLSFLIDDNTWPSIAFGFKYTNLMIHLLNGVLLFWATFLLLKNYKYTENQVIWITLISSSIWVLHPYFVSTTLYVVQRMAQLTTLFTLIGFIGYLKGRLLLLDKPIKAYIYMTVAIGGCTVLATYSKENGALLPLLILVIEFCNPNKLNKPIWQWRAIFLWLPSIAIAYLLSKYITVADNPWPNRNFNMIERLYSETRIVTEYLFNLLIPQIELRGLYQDNYQISKSLTQPTTTLYSILFLLSLFILAFVVKKRYPLFTLAILFFFAAHLMESTVIGLELYFEHRNYLAAVFLFLPIASGLYYLKNYIRLELVILITGIIFSLLIFFTYERVKLWSNTDLLQTYWAKNSPNSIRAQNAMSTILYEHGRIEEANYYLETAIKRFPDSALLNLQLLLQKIYNRSITKQEFIIATFLLKEQSFDGQAVNALRVLVEYIVDNNLGATYGSEVFNLILAMESNNNYKNDYNFRKLVPYLKAKIYLSQNKPKLALDQYLATLYLYNDIEAGLMMVAEMASHKHYLEALELLEQANSVYQNQNIQTLKRSKAEYDSEIPRLKLAIKKLQYQQAKDNHEN